MKHLLAAAIFGLAVLSCSAQTSIDPNPKGGFVIAYNPNGKSAIVWLAYNICRLGFIVKHSDAYPEAGTGDLPPNFGDELHGRSGALEIYVAQREERKIERDEYWEDVKKADSAGFLPEYVWTYFYRDGWTPSDKPKKLDEFSRWSRENIPNHKPETHGKIQFKNRANQAREATATPAVAVPPLQAFGTHS